ncbi:uncharacterized protein Afti isoform X2 [Plodia interpunctella]|uniref:uncharacterized protein Afti isoform X2 n=1 Tax=Plodia interpunctella TaxID=58824 RepID=UPI0023676783|nr:uncharacterized protein LOC128677055 isoform X2 [Plodia interpunctella]
MSIPPLVSSTPPPLEQCEDDKDTEEFDLQYNLPYDDDDGNDYNYGSFSSFNNMQSTASEEPITTTVFSNHAVYEVNNISGKPEEIIENLESATDKNKNQLNIEEEVNIEDLDLKLDATEPPDIKAVLRDNEEEKCESSNHENDLGSISNSSLHIEVSNYPIDEHNTENLEEVFKQNINEEIDTTDVEIVSNEINKDEISNLNEQEHVECSDNINSEIKVDNFDTTSNVVKDEEADDDFDDFQFITSNNKPVNNTIEDVLVKEESPWGKEEPIKSDFGNFTANFEDSSNQSQPENFNDNDKAIMIEDDDFGDFDDFQSSTAGAKNDNCSSENSQQVPVLNLPSLPENENQIMENINKVLTSIFKEEIAESDEILEAKLDSVLNETWGHLMETDVRQPYIVNWNNSLAQKTLLKSLCIDSRNILFGPKWNYNMPKYAANLTTAPLQPQKQVSTSNTQSETTNPDKGTSKSTTWGDPFASNGQESCSNEGENAVIEPRPTDLDVFEASMSTKKDKIYSSSISVQPIRQISLPDTHIFTPTDSETPRSKTIHYDCGPAPTVLIPQPVMDSLKTDENNAVIPPVTLAPSNTETDNEYWEFQNFRGTPVESNPQPSEKKDTDDNALPKSNVTYQTQLLQPIKLEPIIPTLNWPDPGEIKETFEDFTDFMTSSEISAKAVPEEHGKSSNEVPHQSINVEIDVKEGSSKINDSFDDDFDTFQFAVPSKPGVNFEFNSVESNKVCNKLHDNNSLQHENNSEFKCVFPNNNTIKCEDISLSNCAKPLEALPKPIESHYIKGPSCSGISSSILQPISTGTTGQVLTNPGTTQNQPKSGQILQPLSLESYSQINWPNPGIDLQDLSRFNPVETLPSLKNETSGSSKVGTPIHSQKTVVTNQIPDDDIWGEFVSSNPKQTQSLSTKAPALIDDDEWTDFVSSSSVKPQNGLNTISFNVHTNSNIQKPPNRKFVNNNQLPLDIPSLNYITPKTGNHKSYNNKHFQNL